MSQEPEADVTVSWRRRHPVLARSLLYGAGILLAAVAAVLLTERRGVDRQDRLDFVASRLESLDLVAGTDSTGDEMEKVLDEVFAVPDLPAPLRQRALRGRSIQHLKRGETDAALADLEEAAGLATSPVDREAIQLERVLTLVTDGRVEEAQAALAATPATASHSALAIWRSLLEARILVELGQSEAALRALDDGLDALPRPLPDVEPVLFSMTQWAPAGAALHATLSLPGLATTPLGPGPWERLLELAPRDLLAVLKAAKVLQQGGHDEEAARAWAWAVSLNGGLPPADAASDADLATLEKKRVEGLKVEVEGGR